MDAADFAGARMLRLDGVIDRRRRSWSAPLLGLALGLAVPLGAAAQQSAPAVSGPNWDAAVSGGSRDGDGTFVFDGSYTTPLDYSTGLRLDGAAGATEEGFLGGAAAHYFMRNPEVGLIGGFASYSTADPDGSSSQEDMVRLGGESEIYFGNLTVLGTAGAQLSDDVDQGFFGSVGVDMYATDDLMFAVSGEWSPEREQLLRGGLEWQPGYLETPGLAWFVDGAVGNDDFDQVLAGARFYFGAPKSLKDRHRADTFRPGNMPRSDTTEF